MDIRMPLLDGVETTRRIVASGSRSRVLILTTFDLDEYAFAGQRRRQRLPAQERAAAGPADRDPSGRHRRRGRRPQHDPAAVGRLRRPAANPKPPACSRRSWCRSPPEREVLVEIATGDSDAQIADRLVLSEATVKTHVGRILAKLQLHDRVQAVVLAHESGSRASRQPLTRDGNGLSPRPSHRRFTR